MGGERFIEIQMPSLRLSHLNVSLFMITFIVSQLPQLFRLQRGVGEGLGMLEVETVIERRQEIQMLSLRLSILMVS